MSELIELPYGNGKDLALDFLKSYADVKLDVEIEEENDDDSKGISEKYQVFG